jgi:hypothetical protein
MKNAVDDQAEDLVAKGEIELISLRSRAIQVHIHLSVNRGRGREGKTDDIGGAVVPEVPPVQKARTAAVDEHDRHFRAGPARAFDDRPDDGCDAPPSHAPAGVGVCHPDFDHLAG